MSEDFRQEAERHWEFVKGFLKLSIPNFTTDGKIFITEEMAKYLYVEAMVHGYKHGKDDWEG